MKRILAIIVVAVCLLCGCNATSEIEKTVEEFIECVEKDDFEAAALLIHPDREINKDEIASYFALLEKDAGIDISNDFQLIEYEIEAWQEEEPEIEGEYTKVTGLIESEKEGKQFTFDIKLVENEDALGIYKMKFRVKK